MCTFESIYDLQTIYLPLLISASGASAVGQLGEVRVGLIGGLDRDSGLKIILQVTNGASASSPVASCEPSLETTTPMKHARSESALDQS